MYIKQAVFMGAQGKKKRVGLYGGSFNPPHYGHFIAAFYAYHFLGLDEIWMMVTPGNPLKDPAKYAPLADRLELCDILAEDHPWLKPTDIEKEFASGPAVQTADTLNALKRRYPDIEFVWIMGADNLTHFHEWNRWKEIIDNHAIAVLARSGEGDRALASPAARYAAALQVKDPAGLKGRTKGWCFVDTPAFNISSSRLLSDLKAGMRGIRDLPARIEAAILKKGLYGLGAAPPAAPKPPRPF